MWQGATREHAGGCPGRAGGGDRRSNAVHAGASSENLVDLGVEPVATELALRRREALAAPLLRSDGQPRILREGNPSRPQLAPPGVGHRQPFPGGTVADNLVELTGRRERPTVD